MGYLNSVYKQLEQAAEFKELEEKEKRQKSIYQKSFNLLGKTLGLGPIGSAFLPVGLGLSGAMHLGSKLIPDEEIGEIVDATLMTPLFISRLQRASKVANHYNETLHNEKTNYEDYTLKKQLQHGLRALTNTAYATTGIGALSALGLGTAAGAGLHSLGINGATNIGLSLASTVNQLNPLSLLFKGVSTAANLGSSVLSSLGLPHMDLALTVLGMLGAGKLATKITGNLFGKTQKFQIPSVIVPGVQDIMKFSSYQIYLNNIQRYQNLGILKPNEVIIASLLNEINLNTAALIPIYSKLLSNEREVNTEITTQQLMSLFEPDKKSKLSKSEILKRKATYKFFRNLELDTTNMLYQIAGPLMKFITGKSYNEFLEDYEQLRSDYNERKANILKQASKAIKVPTNLLQSLTYSARDFLQAPTYEDKMLGLVSNIHELLRLNTDLMLKKTDNIASVDLYKINKLFEQEDLRTQGIIERIKSFLFSPDNILTYPFRLLGLSIKGISNLPKTLLHPIQTSKNIFEKFRESIKFRLLDSLGIKDPNEIIREYNTQLAKITKKFDLKKSYEAYLGKYFPDDIQEIIYQLKQQTQYLQNMLLCFNCKATKIEKENKKWRGGFGEFLDDELFIKRAHALAFIRTKNNLNIESINPKFKLTSPDTWIFSLLSKISGLKKDELNYNQSLLKEIRDNYYVNDLFKIFNKQEKEDIIQQPQYNQLNKRTLKIIERQENLKKQREFENLFKTIFNIDKTLININKKFNCLLYGFGFNCINGKLISKIEEKTKKDEKKSSFLDNLFGLFGNIGKGIKSLLKIFKKLPLSKLIKSVALLAPAALWLKNKFKDVIPESFKKVFKNLKDKIITGFKKGLGFFENILNKFKDFLTKFKIPFITKPQVPTTIPKKQLPDHPSNPRTYEDPKKRNKKTETKQKINKKLTTISEKEIIKEAEKKVLKNQPKAIKTQQPGFLKRFLKRVAEKLMARGIAKEAVKKILEKIALAGAGIFTGGILSIVGIVLAVVDTVWLAWDIAEIIWETWNETDNDNKKQVVNEAINEAERSNPRVRNVTRLSQNEIHPVGHRNRKTIINHEQVLSNDKEINEYSNFKEFLTKNTEILATGLATLSEILQTQVQQQQVNNQLIAKLIKVVEQEKIERLTILK